jgi:hypothetical protein
MYQEKDFRGPLLLSIEFDRASRSGCVIFHARAEPRPVKMGKVGGEVFRLAVVRRRDLIHSPSIPGRRQADGPVEYRQAHA